MSNLLQKLINKHLRRLSKTTAGAVIITLGAVVLVLIGLLVSLEDQTSAQILGADSGAYLVVRVVDGDTIRVLINGQEEVVRLIGIDTPELNHPQKPVECFAKEASDKLKSLLQDRQVQLEFDPTQAERDRYGRLLAYVFLDGNNINLQMLRDGYAYEYTYSSAYKYQQVFKNAQQLAKSQLLGLWSGDCGGDIDGI